MHLTHLYRYVTKLFEGIPELVVRKMQLKKGNMAAVVYMSNLVDKETIYNYILTPFLSESINDYDLFDLTLPFVKGKHIKKWKYVEQGLLNGKCIVFIDEYFKIFEFEVEGWPKRAIEDTKVESAIKSSHQGFVETSSENIALIRRYIPSRELKVKEYFVGDRAPVKVSVMYLGDVVSLQVIKEVEQRLELINIDTIINSGQLEELIEDNTTSPFPQFF